MSLVQIFLTFLGTNLLEPENIIIHQLYVLESILQKKKKK